uniref:Uncharacterized protein n=1 Tax=Ditylenchus dipsaci TaxID=166011 RepID=A0A915DT27_9BILA
MMKSQNKKEILECRACRFDRSILMGMNPLSIQLPKNADKDTIVAELAQRKNFLKEKNNMGVIVQPK